MKKNYLLLFLLISFFSFGQNKEYLPSPKYPNLFRSIPVLNDSEPEWVRIMYSEKPNIFEIERAYDDYYSKNKFKKTIHTRNLNGLHINLQSIQYQIEENGDIIQLSAEELIKKRSEIETQSANKTTQSVNLANWQPLGPMEVYGTEFNNNVARKESNQSNVYCVDVSATNENLIYIGVENNFVFKSIDKGEHWFSVTENLLLDSGVRSVAIAASNNDVVYFGTVNSLFKTTDGGTTWTTLFTISNSNIESINIDTTNPDIVLIATSQGLKRSINGGTTFTTIFSDKAWDIDRNTANPSIVYVGKTNTTLNRSEVWRSIDNGLTFSPITSGWFTPTNTTALSNGGIRIATTPADANRLYAVVLGDDVSNAEDVGFIGVFRSDNGGDSWYLPFDADNNGTPNNDIGGPYTNATSNWCLVGYGPYNGTASTGHQGFYDLDIEISDVNPDYLFVGGSGMYKSTNGGKTYQGYAAFYCPSCNHHQHLDIQGIKSAGNFTWVASDGGMNLYDVNLNPISAKNYGLNAPSNWHFGQGWNTDVLVSGTYHNGDNVFYEGFETGKYRNIGGVERGTGYVEIFDNSKVHHSDANSRKLSSNINENFPVIAKYSMFPNEHYDPVSNYKSDVFYDTTYGNVFYIGNENKIYKTTDNGQNFTVLYTFGTNVNNKITDIALTNDDKNYMYAVQKISSASILWKSTDGGITWNQLTLPLTGTLIRIQVAQDDKNEIYYSRNNSSGNKIYKSINGGVTWTVLSTSVLSGQSVRNLVLQDGTDGGIYAFTSTNRLYYKNNSLPDWQNYYTGLPSSYESIKSLPFYRDGKLRSSGSRGFWETPLFEDSKPIARPISLRETYYCAQDTVKFECYSILKHQGATWNWQFPGASYVSSTSARNPQVLYPNAGSYDVTLTITDANGFTSTKTIYNMIKVLNNSCNQVVTNSSKSFNSVSGTNLKNETLNYDGINTYTISCWIKPRTQNYDNKPLTSIGFSDGNFTKLELSTANEVRFHYNTNSWGSSFASGLFVNTNQWNYVAVVVTPTQFTLYVNDKKYTRVNTVPIKNFRKFIIGQSPLYHWWMHYLGEIDEVKFWKRSLSENEIKLNRHIIKTDVATDVDLISYYQFDEVINDNSVIIDKKNGLNLMNYGSGGLVDSTAPVGVGVSEKQNITTLGNYNFPTTGVEMNFTSGTYPNGEVFVTKLSNAPFGQPTTNYISENNYWIINNYGTNSTINSLNTIKFAGVFANPTLPSEIKIFNRTDNAFDSSFWLEKGSATQYNSTTTIAEFSGAPITSFGQFYFGSDAAQTIPCGMFTTTWNGTLWNNGKPNLTTSAIINGDFTVNEEFNACSLTIQGTSNVVLNSLQKMTVKETISVAPTANFTINNNSNLIQIDDVANTGTLNLIRNSNPLMRLDYTIWSSPVSGSQTLKQFSPSTLNNRFYNYNTSTNLYNAVPNPVTQLFEEGKGFLIRMPDNHPTTPTIWQGIFTGVPNNGLVTQNLTYLGVGQGFNMIGNPYPSTIDANQFIAQNSSSINGTLYFWRKINNASGTAYATYTLAGSTTTPSSRTPTNIIQAGQGFLVEAKTANPTVSFTNAMRVGNFNNLFFRNANEVEAHRFWLNLSHNTAFQNQMLVAYMTDATQDVDEAIDGKNINDNQISLTSAINNSEFTIQGRALPFENSDVVPLLFKTNVAGNFSVAIHQVDGLFDQGQEILIKDNALNLIHSLNESDYTFSSEAGNFAYRFEIVYQNSLLNNNEFTFDNIIMYPNPISDNEDLFIKGLKNETTVISIFDITGKTILNQKMETDKVRISDLSSGIYLVKIETKTKTVTKKLIVK